MMKRSLLMIILMLVALVVGIRIAIRKQSPPEVRNFSECAAAGYPIAESYPEQCRTPDGRVFFREIPNQTDSQ